MFDVSGARSLDLRYTRTTGQGGVSGSYFVIALPVPEPTGIMLVASCIATGVAFLARQKNAKAP